MATMLNNGNFEHWCETPKSTAKKIMLIITFFLAFCLLLAFVLVKATQLFVVEPAVQTYNDVTEKIERNVQSLSKTLNNAIEEAKKIPVPLNPSQALPTNNHENIFDISSLFGQSKVINSEQAKRVQKLTSNECRFWLENDKNKPSARTKAEVAKYCVYN